MKLYSLKDKTDLKGNYGQLCDKIIIEKQSKFISYLFEISKEESYEKYINKFNVITLDIQSMIALNQGAKGVVSYIQKSVCKELADEILKMTSAEEVENRLKRFAQS